MCESTYTRSRYSELVSVSVSKLNEPKEWRANHEEPYYFYGGKTAVYFFVVYI